MIITIIIRIITTTRNTHKCTKGEKKRVKSKGDRIEDRQIIKVEESKEGK